MDAGRDTELASQEHIDAGLQFVDAVNRGDFDAALRLVHPEVVYEDYGEARPALEAAGLSE